MKSIISSDSEVRADVFPEMIELAEREPTLRRYSNSLYNMAAVLLLCCRSSSEFMHGLLPIPPLSSVHSHFREKLTAKIARLKSIDEIEPYLVSRISVYARIAEGVVLAVDTVSCTNNFVGMRQVDTARSVIYLLFIYSQLHQKRNVLHFSLSKVK
jgi:hypothetical protein